MIKDEQLVKTKLNFDKVDVYDNIFSSWETREFFEFIQNSIFKIDGRDDFAIPLEMQMYSLFDEADLNSLGIQDNPKFRAIQEKYGVLDMQLKNLRVNVTTPAERNRIHTDMDGITILYYANLEWRPEWGGHTLFTDDLRDEFEGIVSYKPNRVVVFDGKVPHMILTPSVICPTFRLSLAFQYERIK